MPRIVAESLRSVADPLRTGLVAGPTASGAEVARSLAGDLAPAEVPACPPDWLLPGQVRSARRALAALEGLVAVGSTEWLGETTVRVTLAASSDASVVVRTLVLAGIGVDRVEPARHSLEDRFLSLTSSLGDS